MIKKYIILMIDALALLNMNINIIYIIGYMI